MLLINYWFHGIFAAKNNIGVVIALWSPVILVWVICYFSTAFYLSMTYIPSGWQFTSFFIYLEIICVFFLSRFISWIPRYGMLYSPPFLEVYMVHFVALERLGEHPSGDINIYINCDLPRVVLDSSVCINFLVAVSELSSWIFLLCSFNRIWKRIKVKVFSTIKEDLFFFWNSVTTRIWTIFVFWLPIRLVVSPLL